MIKRRYERAPLPPEDDLRHATNEALDGVSGHLVSGRVDLRSRREALQGLVERRRQLLEVAHRGEGEVLPLILRMLLWASSLWRSRERATDRSSITGSVAKSCQLARSRATCSIDGRSSG